MRNFIAAMSAVVLSFALTTMAAADVGLSPVRADMKTSAKTESKGLRCRALQRTAQAVIATEGFDSPRGRSGRRRLHGERRLPVSEAETRTSKGRSHMRLALFFRLARCA